MFAQVDIMLTHCLSFIALMLVPLPFRAHLLPVLFLCGIIYKRRTSKHQFLSSYVQFINAHGDTKYAILWIEEGGQFVGDRVQYEGWCFM